MLGMAQALDALPRALFSYDTAVPWRTFAATTAGQVLLTVFPALIEYALWLAWARSGGGPACSSD